MIRTGMNSWSSRLAVITGKSLKFVSAMIAFMFMASALWVTAQAPADANWKPVEDAMGRSGQMQPGDVIRFGMPRKDLHVSLGDVTIKAGLALGSWTAFMRTADGAMVMGDLVLTEDEVGPVMRKLEERGIDITAIHNHLISESPHVVYMHIEGHGDAVKMAGAIHEALGLTKTPGPDSAPAPASSEPLGIDQKAIEEILGRNGKVNGGILQFGVPRAETIKDNGMTVPPALGVATAINFQPTGGGKAAITGDFVLLGKEANPVMKALRDNGIQVAALHSHMLTEEPRLFFMHFWANDDAAKLAKGLREAIDLTNSKK
jgi:Domain of Unknown Function (DUF1259)